MRFKILPTSALRQRGFDEEQLKINFRDRRLFCQNCRQFQPENEALSRDFVPLWVMGRFLI